MNKTLILALLLVTSFLAAMRAEAANRYVRAGSSGNGSGNDWANAYTTLPSSLIRGDSYYIADGNYGSYRFGTPASGATLITIKKATVSDHGTNVGWDDSFGNGQAVFGQLRFDSSYWLVDGQTGGGPGNWKTGFGFKVSWSNPTPLIYLPTNAVSNVTIRHMELQGTSNSSGGGGLAQDAVGLYGAHAFTISHFYTHAIGRCPFFISPGNGFLAEYGYIADYVHTAAAHSEIASIWAFGGTFPTSTTTFRYNIFGYLQGTGGLMWDNSSNHGARLDVYGNVFWKDPNLSGFDNNANGVIGGWTGNNGEDFYNAHVYNNSFVNIPGAQVLSTFPRRSGNNEARNNLFYAVQSPGGGSVWQTVTDNHFISTSPIGTTSSTGSGDPFVNMTNLNFSLRVDTPAGVTLPTPYNTDMLGAVRGADATWDKGAIAFSSGGGTGTPPSAPTNLIVQ